MPVVVETVQARTVAMGPLRIPPAKAGRSTFEILVMATSSFLV
jgi:hypothetical protein